VAEDAPKVPNPFYAELQRLREQVSSAAPDITGALDDPTRNMVDGQAWRGTGPAEAFEQELTGRKSRLGTLVQEVLDQIDAKLATTEQMVPATVAHSYHNALRVEGVR
jgi:hypothetical protein